MPMFAIKIAAGLAGVAAAGCWLRWACVPVHVAYQAGRKAERASVIACLRQAPGHAGRAGRE